MSNTANYTCSVHGPVAVAIRNSAPTTAPCPRCGREAPRTHDSQRCVSVTAATYQRMQAHCDRHGLSLAQLIDALTADLGAAS